MNEKKKFKSVHINKFDQIQASWRSNKNWICELNSIIFKLFKPLVNISILKIGSKSLCEMVVSIFTWNVLVSSHRKILEWGKKFWFSRSKLEFKKNISGRKGLFPLSNRLKILRFIPHCVRKSNFSFVNCFFLVSKIFGFLLEEFLLDWFQTSSSGGILWKRHDLSQFDRERLRMVHNVSLDDFKSRRFEIYEYLKILFIDVRTTNYWNEQPISIVSLVRVLSDLFEIWSEVFWRT